MLREMRGPEGGFYSALDADSEGEEGRFYVWTPDEIREVLGNDPNCSSLSNQQVERLLAFYGVSDRGNFEGANILHLAEGRGSERCPRGSTRRGSALFEARAKRVRPGLDDKRLAAWNALAIAALAEAGAVLGREDYLDAARGLRRVRPQPICATPTGACCAPTRTAAPTSTPTSRTTPSCSRRC